MFCCNQALLTIHSADFGQIVGYLPLSLHLLSLTERIKRWLLKMDLISFACFNVCALFPSFYVSPTELSSQKMMYLLSNSWFLLRLLINMDIRYSSPFWGQEACLIPHENPYIITNKQDLFSRCKVGNIIKSFVILNCCSERHFF